MEDQKSSDTSLTTANCQQPTTGSTLPSPFASNLFDKALFKAVLDIGEHHLTGLMFVKKIPDTGFQITHSVVHSVDTISPLQNTYRLVFSNEFGMTYFDAEVGTGRFQLNYCFEPLNRKMLWKILETDFRLLFASETAASPGKLFIQDDSNYMVYKNKQTNIQRWDLFASHGDTLAEVRGKSNFTDKAFISFKEYKSDFPTKLIIENPLIKLKFSLSLLSLN